MTYAPEVLNPVGNNANVKPQEQAKCCNAFNQPSIRMFLTNSFKIDYSLPEFPIVVKKNLHIFPNFQQPKSLSLQKHLLKEFYLFNERTISRLHRKQFRI